MILADKTIKKALADGQIKIEPYLPKQLQPASYDVTLGNDFLVFDNTKARVIDPREKMAMRKVACSPEDPFILHPGEFALAATAEIIGVDNEHLAILNGKSSLGRIGLLIHATAGFIDPGNELRITLELFNVATMPILLYPGMKIAQVVFEKISEPCERPYGHPDLGSKYYRDLTVKESHISLNFTADDKN